jgi:hypothetical protein
MTKLPRRHQLSVNWPSTGSAQNARNVKNGDWKPIIYRDGAFLCDHIQMPSFRMRALTSLLTRFRSDESGALVPDIAKAAIAISFLSVIAANVISNRIDTSEKNAMAAITGDAARGRNVDNAATGSLARNANATKIDPCELPARR